MGGDTSKSSGMMRGFVPGLICGLIVGAFLGAVVPPFLDSKELSKMEDGAVPGAAVDHQREEREEGYTNTGDYDEATGGEAPAEKAESDQPTEEPAKTTPTPTTTPDADAGGAGGAGSGDGGGSGGSAGSGGGGGLGDGGS